MLRSIVAVLAGLVAGAVLFQAAAVIVLLAAHGIPLGSESVRPGAATYAALLAGGVLAAWAGTRLALRIAGAHRLAVALALAAVMTAVVLAGFGKAASQWPRWFSWALAAAALAGVSVGAARPRRGS